MSSASRSVLDVDGTGTANDGRQQRPNTKGPSLESVH